MRKILFALLATPAAAAAALLPAAAAQATTTTTIHLNGQAIDVGPAGCVPATS